MATPSIPDNRIRFPAPKIDFENEVGVTGQDHDNYPAPATQARFDWLRMVIIGLLSNQASYDEPTQYREGTVWFDLNTNQLRIWMGSASEGGWQPIAKAIVVGEPPAGTTTAPTLWDMYQTLNSLEARIAALE